MRCVNLPFPFLYAAIVGAVLAILVYLVSRWRGLEVAPAMESGACGSGIIAGLYLTYGAICPVLLVHLVDGKGNYVKLTELFLRVGNQYRPADITLQIGELHAIHIFLGGVATVLVACLGLARFCRRS